MERISIVFVVGFQYFILVTRFHSLPLIDIRLHLHRMHVKCPHTLLNHTIKNKNPLNHFSRAILVRNVFPIVFVCLQNIGQVISCRSIVYTLLKSDV